MSCAVANVPLEFVAFLQHAEIAFFFRPFCSPFPAFPQKKCRPPAPEADLPPRLLPAAGGLATRVVPRHYRGISRACPASRLSRALLISLITRPGLEITPVKDGRSAPVNWLDAPCLMRGEGGTFKKDIPMGFAAPAPVLFTPGLIMLTRRAANREMLDT